MKAFFVLLALFIVSFIIIDAWGVWTFIMIIIILIMLFLYIGTQIKKPTKTQNTGVSDSKKKIDHYAEATAANQYRNTNKRGTHKGFKFEDIEGHERLSGEILEQDLSEADPSDFFYDKKVVFTGKLSTYDREDLALLLKQRGADINATISKKTDIVIIGENPGPSKMEQIGKRLEAGDGLLVIYEDDLEGYVTS